MADAAPPDPQTTLAPARRAWSLPTLRELPKLTELTLASPIGGGGGTGGGGSTVFGILLALLTLGACSPDRLGAPSDPVTPKGVAAVSCAVNVAAQEVSCGGPQMVGGGEIIGGQGTRIALRSRNVAYTGADSSFQFDVSLQNLTAQVLGSDGPGSSGIYVFFTAEPVATAGAGDITVVRDGEDSFTAPGQDYFWYDETALPGQITSERAWEFKVPDTVDEFTFTVLVAADVPDQGGILRWQEVAGMSTGMFHAVAVQNTDDMMALGAAGGRSYRWNGVSWQALSPVSGQEFLSVAPLGSGEYVAVGTGGAMFRSKGTLWTQFYTHPGVTLQNVWVQDADHLTAVGGHFIVTCSFEVCTSEDIGLSALGLGWVGGTSDGTTRIAMSFEGEIYRSGFGGAWVAEGIPFFITVGDYFPTGLIVDPDGKYITSLVSTTVPTTKVVKEGGSTLYSIAALAEIKDIVWVGEDTIVALVGDFGLGGQTLVRVAYTGVPTSLSLTGGQASAHGTDLACADLACGEFILTAPGNTPTMRWDGGQFVAVQAGPIGGPVDLALAGSTVLEVAGGTEIWEITGTAVTAVPTGLTGLRAIATVGAAGPHERVVVDGANTLHRWNGTGWDMMHPLSGGGEVHDVWGGLADRRWVMVGASGQLADYTDGGGLTNHFTGDIEPLTRVWGCGPIVWTGSTAGKIYRLQGGLLTEEFGIAVDGGVGAISGTSCADVWVVGKDGQVFHYDGSDWSDLGHSLGNLASPSIWLRAPGQAYIGGGNDGRFFLVDLAAGLIPMAYTAGSDRILASMVATPDGALYVAGSGFVARGVQ